MGLSDRILLVVERIAAEFKSVRSDVAAGSAAFQGEIDALSDVVATKATQSNVDSQLATKASATDLDNVFGIATAAIPSTQKGSANGVATLGVDSKIPASQLPALAVTEFLGTSADQADMLAKTGQLGDWTTRTDLSTVWIITGSDPTQLSSWTQMSYPTAPVTTVAGRTGAVVLTKSDVGLSNADNTADSAKPVSTAQQAALDLKAPLASPTFTGTVSGVTKAHVGLGNVDNTSDANKPVSSATQTALNLKAPLASPAFTGTPTGITKAHVGLGNVDNTSDANKPVSTAQASAIAAKVGSPNSTITGLAYYPTVGDLPATGVAGVIYFVDSV